MTGMYMAVARFYEDIKDEPIAAEAAPKQVEAEAAPAAEEPKKEEGA